MVIVVSTVSRVDVDRSTLRLSDVARHIVVPAGIERSLWLGWDGQSGVEERVREFGFEFDRWQDGLAQLELGVTAAGQFAATVGGIILSIPRQVAKTFMTMVIVLALCSMFPSLTVLWTAHRARLSTQTFRKMKALTRSKGLSKYILPGPEGVRSTNGEQEIRFRNGSVIMFGAREHGFGLGFDEVDIEVFDEAQRLTSNALDDMVAATNQSRWAFGALLFFMGTPPRPTDEGEEFTARRAKALAVKSSVGVADFGGLAVGGESVYVECSADPSTGHRGGPDINDRDQVRLANPSYPHRTPEVSVRRLREQLTNDDSWRREALGIWDEETGLSSKIPSSSWSLNGCPPVEVMNPVVAVDFRTGLEQAFAIGVAGSTLRDGVPVDVVDIAAYEFGVGKMWPAQLIVDEVLAVLKRNALASVVVDAYGDGNGSLIPLLEDAGVTVVKLNLTDMRNGAVGFASANVNGDVLHVVTADFDVLNVAVAGAGTRKSGNGFVWAQEKSSVDITTLRAVTAAWWAHRSTPDYDVDDSFF
jgi:hypothetical protein